MQRSTQQLREDALAIWHAGVAAVDSVQLMLNHVHVDGEFLSIDGELFSLRSLRRIVVVGAGKAGAGMAEGLESALGEKLLDEKDVTGWINVPEDCVRPLRRIHLHAARPAGVNEPMEAGVVGTAKILELLSFMTPADLCLCLISGGGSALLPAPIPGITLDDKKAITKHLSSAGANIRELNTVRKQLSRIKGGGLARACTAGHLVTLIISDVLGDPLDVIASGPTVPDSGSPEYAWYILQKYHAREAGISPVVFRFLEDAIRQKRSPEKVIRTLQTLHEIEGELSPDQLRLLDETLRYQPPTAPIGCSVTNLVISNNATAVDAAGIEAERRGYSHAMLAARELEGAAEDVGRHHADLAWRMRHEAGPDALITGGEPTVKLVEPEKRGKGGRNQQLVLAALRELITLHSRATKPSDANNPLNGIVLLSGGTDGEDGPTDAAGAIVDAEVFRSMQKAGIDTEDFLARNDAYRFFEPLNGLLKTGPTHTNVCDLRVVVTNQ